MATQGIVFFKILVFDLPARPVSHCTRENAMSFVITLPAPVPYIHCRKDERYFKGCAACLLCIKALHLFNIIGG